MVFTFDPTLADPLSRSRAMLIDTAEASMMFPDEAYQNYADLYGWDIGTANLAVIAKNKYGNMPTTATLDGLGTASWRDRMLAWDTVIQYALGGSVSGTTMPTDPNVDIPPSEAVQQMQIEVTYTDDPYVLRDYWGRPIPRELWRTPWGRYPW